MANDNSLFYYEVRRQLVEITQSREGDYMNVDALNLAAVVKVVQGGQIKFSAELSL